MPPHRRPTMTFLELPALATSEPRPLISPSTVLSEMAYTTTSTGMVLEPNVDLDESLTPRSDMRPIGGRVIGATYQHHTPEPSMRTLF